MLHSKFKKSDKKALFDKTLKSFGQNGSKEYDLLRSAPIVQAALNITCMRMLSEFTYAENWLQRLGRLDRFSENKAVNLYICAITENVKKGSRLGLSANTLYKQNSLQSAKAWYEFLQDKLTDKPLTISEIYQLYQDFYDEKNITCRDAIKQDFIKALKESVINIDINIPDPVRTSKNKNADTKKVKIKKSSLRGNNRFVQMAVCLIADKDKPDFPNQYAYDEENYDGELTYSVKDILGNDDSEKDLLEFMVKNHHSIKDAEKYGVTSTTKFKNKIYLNKARDAETPIYLSYTPDDLKIVEEQSKPYAIFYAIGISQAIGAISKNDLLTEVS